MDLQKMIHSSMDDSTSQMDARPHFMYFEEVMGMLYLGQGRSRIVYLNPYTNSVVKIPYNWEGCHANDTEERRYRENHNYRYARCTIELIDNIPVLHMEKVKRMKYDDSPDWACWVDCCQVGYAPDGRIVAYDYADNPI